jgi:hypothetical protein
MEVMMERRVVLMGGWLAAVGILALVARLGSEQVNTLPAAEALPGFHHYRLYRSSDLQGRVVSARRKADGAYFQMSTHIHTSSQGAARQIGNLRNLVMMPGDDAP